MRRSHLRAVLVVSLIAFAPARADDAPAPPARCPEQCGVVLELCLEKYRKRHQCLALTDVCFQDCKAGAPVLDANGDVLPQYHPQEGVDLPIRW